MKPVELAAKVYQQESCSRSFRDDLELHLLNGFVFSTPEFFIMGRPVPARGEAKLVTDPAWVFPPELCDTWMVYLHAGDMRKAWNIMPWYLPYISFERRNELRVYKLDTIKRLSGTLPAV